MQIKKIVAACMLACPLVSVAMQNHAPVKNAFIGLGGSYNSITMNESDSLVGISRVYSGTTQVAHGTAIGPSTPIHLTQNTFAPTVQAGYFAQVKNNWLLGFKLAYLYYGTSFTENNIVAPQAGAFITDSGSNSFTGRATIGSMQTTMTHKISFIPFVGYNMQKFYLYMGVGPALYDTQSNIYDVVGYADVNGTHLDVSGQPSNFSSSKWVWGGDAQLGAMYYFAPDWFVDANYSYAIVPPYNTSYSGPFSSTSNGNTTTGTLNGTTTQRFTVGMFAVSVNYAIAA